MVNIIALTKALRAEYVELFTTCAIRPNRQAMIERLINKVVANKARYEAVGVPLEVPWHFIAAIHNMESTQDFTCHLHNGDPLTARTAGEPAGRPKNGYPPFSWEQSAVDALVLKGLGRRTEWSLSGTLFQLERYNGFGYRLYHPRVLSPYLWSFSGHYSAGKYVGDNDWSDTATSDQCGAAVLLRRMAERNLFSFADQPPPEEDAEPMVVSYATKKSGKPDVLAQVIALQSWLSSHPGIFLKPDGVPGPRTSDAYKAVTGSYLPGDPRGE